MLGGVSFAESDETDTNLYGPSSSTNHQQHDANHHSPSAVGLSNHHHHANNDPPYNTTTTQHRSALTHTAASPKSFLSSFSSQDGTTGMMLGRNNLMGHSGNSHESSTFGSVFSGEQSQQLPPISPHSSRPTSPNNHLPTTTTTTTTTPPGRNNNGGGLGSLFRRHSGLSKFQISQSASSQHPETNVSSHDDNGDERQQQQQQSHSPNSTKQGNINTKRSLLSFGSRRNKKKKHVVSPASSAAASSAAYSSPTSYSDEDEYQSSLDDEDDDGFESSPDKSHHRGHPPLRNDPNRMIPTSSAQLHQEDHHHHSNRSHKPLPVQRFRGFSTSISSLFLDEPVVCGAMSCFGLLLSQRTEHLLNLRNERRGVTRRILGNKEGGRRTPSKVLAWSLLGTIALIYISYCIWGFGTNTNYNNNNDYENNNYNYNGEEQDDNNRLLLSPQQQQQEQQQQQQQQHFQSSRHYIWGIAKVRDAHQSIWEPVLDFLHHEWNRPILHYVPPELRRSLENENDEYDYNYSNDDDFNDNSGGSVGTYVSEPKDMGSSVRSCVCLLFLAMLGIVGRRRRMRTRFAVLRARAQEDHLHYSMISADAGGGPSMKRMSREDQYEGACSHTLCGCYPTDPPGIQRRENQMEVQEYQYDCTTGATSGPSSSSSNSNDNKLLNKFFPCCRKKQRRHGDFVVRFFACISSACCGVTLKFWVQCLSICALAQEAREARLLLPPKMQRIDLITHQPFMEYQKASNDLRLGWVGKMRPRRGIMPHIQALSKLSRYLIAFFVVTVIAIILTLVFNKRAIFFWGDAVVLVATFVQSFIVIYVVHWLFHKSDLSLDAVIKFYAAGFIIAVPTAYILEGIVVNIMLLVVYSLYAILEACGANAALYWVDYHYRLEWFLGEMINAFIVAAAVEELCKYYTFRMVEHPDLLFLTGLDRVAQEGHLQMGGAIRYPYGSHNVSESNADPDTLDVAESKKQASRIRANTGKPMKQRGALGNFDGFEPEDEFPEEDNDIRSPRQRAAAVTTAMISVAVGLACAENFLYVFVLGGSGENNDGYDQKHGYMEAFMVLLFRSIFPVHALAAALQSINVIRKFVEDDSSDGGHRVGVGRIVFPAVLMHGSFDAILMTINVYIETAWDDYLAANNGNADNGRPYNPIIVNMSAALGIIAVMCIGTWWYYKERRKQSARLKIIEDREKLEIELNGSNVNNNGNSNYVNPVL